MFRRATWLGVGLVVGVGASKWVEHQARRRLARYLPVNNLPRRLGTELAGKARDLAEGKVADLRTAVEGGRSAMAERESELRRQLRFSEQVNGGPAG